MGCAVGLAYVCAAKHRRESPEKPGPTPDQLSGRPQKWRPRRANGPTLADDDIRPYWGDGPGRATVAAPYRARSQTGIARTTTLTYIPDGERYLVVGSNWGRAAHPAWTANLLAIRHVTIACRRDQFTAAARVLLGAERDRAWHTIVAAWPNYRIAQEMAGGREFRIFELLPSPNPPEHRRPPHGLATST